MMLSIYVFAKIITRIVNVNLYTFFFMLHLVLIIEHCAVQYTYSLCVLYIGKQNTNLIRLHVTRYRIEHWLSDTIAYIWYYKPLNLCHWHLKYVWVSLFSFNFGWWVSRFVKLVTKQKQKPCVKCCHFVSICISFCAQWKIHQQ